MADHRIGTIYAELDLDPSKYTKAQQTLLKDATQVSLKLEDNFKKLGVKSSAELDLMRRKIQNSYDMIAHSAQATANDIIRAEEMKNAKLKALDEQQYGRQVSAIGMLKSHWLGATAAIAASIGGIRIGWDLAKMGAAYEEQRGMLDNLAAKYQTTADEIVESMRTASDGMVSNASLMEVAVGGLAKGLSPDQLISLAGAAEILGDAVGNTATEALNDLTQALETGRTKGLKNYLGTSIDLEATFGDLVSKMTAAEKSQALYNLTMISATELQKRQKKEVDDSANKIDQIQVSYDNAKLALGRWAKVAVAASFDFLVASKALFSWDPKRYEKEVGDQIRAQQQARAAAQGSSDTYEALNAKLKEELEWREAGKKSLKEHTKEREAHTKALEKEAKAMKENMAKAQWLSPDQASATEATNAYMGIGPMSNTEMMRLGNRAAVETKDNASEISSAYRKMYKDLGGASSEYYQFELDALEGQRNSWEQTLVTEEKDAEKSAKNKILIEKWHLSEQKKIYQQMTLSSNDFFKGVKVGWERMQDDQYTWAKGGLDMFEEFASSGRDALSDGLFDAVKGDLKSFEDYWDSFFDSMLRTLTDTVSQMAVQWGINAAVSAGSSWGWWDSGLWEAKKDHPAIIHKGEMVVPADIAAKVRGESGSRSMNELSAVSPSGGHEWGSMEDNRTLNAMARGTMRSWALNTAQGVSLYAQGMIDTKAFMAGLFNPTRVVAAEIAGGIPAGVRDLMGLDQSNAWANWGQTIGGVLGAFTTGYSGPLGVAAVAGGGSLGAVIGDAIGDAFNGRNYESTRDAFEDAYGRIEGAQRFADIVQGITALEKELGMVAGIDYDAMTAFGGGGENGRDLGGNTPGSGSGMPGGGEPTGSGVGHRSGLNYVPRDDYHARLHEGEAVLTKEQAAAWRGGRGGNGGLVIEDLRIYIGDEEVTGRVKMIADGVIVERNRAGVNPTARVYN